MASLEHTEPAGYDGLPPKLLAEIVQKVTHEGRSLQPALLSLVKLKPYLVVEHLNRPGSVEDLESPLLQEYLSNKSNSALSPPSSTQQIYISPSPTQGQSQTPKPKKSSQVATK